MSHLPLDARAILGYLNELGYTNITAEQLKEFLKGMQPQSDISKSKQKPPRGQSSQQKYLNTTAAAAAGAGASVSAGTSGASASAPKQSPRHHHQPSHVKLVKGKKPLSNFKFYLDICDHQLTKRIEEQIKQLGGALEFFLTPAVTHFITDKTVRPPSVNANNANNNTSSSRPGTPQTPATPQTPQTPYSVEAYDGGKSTATSATVGNTTASRPARQSRADAILNRARRQSSTVQQQQQQQTTPSRPVGKDLLLGKNETSVQYTIWQTEYALVYLKRVLNDLKQYLDSKATAAYGIVKYGKANEPIHLKGTYIKVEAKKPHNRPYYHYFRKPCEWPKIELRRDDGAFRLSPKKSLEEVEHDKQVTNNNNNNNIMTRKSRSRSSQRPLPGGGVQALKKGAAGGGDATTAKSKNSTAGGDSICKQQQQQQPQQQQNKESSDKQCGVCEICKIEYDTLTIHLKTKDHEFFAKNSQNFLALDTLINSSADVNKFLQEQNIANESAVVEMEVDEEAMDVDVDRGDVEACADAEDPLAAVVVAATAAAADNSGASLSLSEPSPPVKRRSSGAPSPPGIREKSKRTTKGKHSSEKFQYTTPGSVKQQRSPTKSPKTPPKAQPTSSSPLKKPPSSSLAEMQRIESAATANAVSVTTPTTTRRKASACSAAALSPPIRAMLPPSSLYKVVESTTQDLMCSPSTRLRGEEAAAAANIGSPSLIVKFQKVRQTEVLRLNGEAESFIYAKHRQNSSDLPTDIDRQTTSDNIRTRISSISLDSLSSSVGDQVDTATTENDCVEPEAASTHNLPANTTAEEVDGEEQRPQGRAIAKAKRRGKGGGVAPGTPPKQSFPTAPIQPESQLNRIRTIPEATRKSSRMATAIVTAATTSSRMLREAVEAAKNKSRLSVNANASAAATPVVTTTTTTTAATTTTPALVALLKGGRRKNSLTTAGRTSPVAVVEPKPVPKPAAYRRTGKRTALTRRLRISVVKVEDRMGDIDGLSDDELQPKKDDIQPNQNAEDLQANKDDELRLNKADNKDDRHDETAHDDENYLDDDDHHHVAEDDDEDDEDYMASDSKYNRSKRRSSGPLSSSTPAGPSVTARRRRGRTESAKLPSPLVKRQLRKRSLKAMEMLERSDEEDEDFPDMDQTPTAGGKRKSKPLRAKPKNRNCQKKAASVRKPTPHQQWLCDYSNSEPLNALRYAFERVPSDNLWYRVFTRQDECQEQYYQYFGSTNYRKLPYEMGPIPFQYTVPKDDGCNLCSGHKDDVDCAKVLPNHSIAATTTTPIAPKVTTKANKVNIKQELLDPDEDVMRRVAMPQTVTTSTLPTATNSSASYAHKHKKLHLLQRYRQEQELLQQRQSLDPDQAATPNISKDAEERLPDSRLLLSEALAAKCDSKASTPDRERNRQRERPHERERAGSAHSTASSCASSTATNAGGKHYRNKHLSRAAYLSLELPPRKSPREHASTLALVSIIKQRQDSQSKSNSEIDEPLHSTTPIPPTTTTKPVVSIKQEPQRHVDAMPFPTTIETKPLLSKLQARLMAASTASSSVPKVATATSKSPRPVRSAAGTPIEELRFATEISETVKKMRRGQNKYDHSPPYGLGLTRSPRKSRPLSALGQHYRQDGLVKTLKRENRKKRGPVPAHLKQQQQSQQHSFVGAGRASCNGQLPSIRKTGSKKGVLEFEVDACALKSLQASITQAPFNERQLEWKIDRFLEMAGKDVEFDLADMPALHEMNASILPEEPSTDSTDVAVASSNKKKRRSSTKLDEEQEASSSAGSVAQVKRLRELTAAADTPPRTDYFSSDFDLYDLISSPPGGSLPGEEETTTESRKNHSLYNLGNLTNYYRKRKNLKSNRTGWPKVQKKKSSVRQQQRVRFLQGLCGIKQEPRSVIDEEEEEPPPPPPEPAGNDEGGEEHENAAGKAKGDKTGEDSGMITPPDTEAELDDELEHRDKEELKAKCDTAGEEMELEAADSVREEEEDEEEEEEEDADTIADSIEEEEEEEAAEANNQADEEDAADEEEDEEVEAEEDDDEEEEEEEVIDHADSDTDCKLSNRRLRSSHPISPAEKLVRHQHHHPHHHHHHPLTVNNVTVATSTPTTQMLRSSRRTPQQLLNGSIGSCISPSEKTADNSDIFTVSSDGLDTDLDVSNPQLLARTDDDHAHHNHYGHNANHQQNHHHNHNNSSSSSHHNQSAADGSCPHQTPKRKYDITKYAPNNGASSTCAAEAATAAAKSLAISQFLKKEVRVQCRRIRAPFRRFRFRR